SWNPRCVSSELKNARSRGLGTSGVSSTERCLWHVGGVCAAAVPIASTVAVRAAPKKPFNFIVVGLPTDPRLCIVVISMAHERAGRLSHDSIEVESLASPRLPGGRRHALIT